MWKNRTLRAAAVGLAALALGACHTGKSLTEPQKGTETETSHGIFRATEKTAPAFRSMEAKGTFSVEIYNQNLSAKGTIRILTDSCISISLQPFIGIEVGRLHAGRDSIVVIDRIHSVYYAATYDEIRRATGIFVDYETLQNMLCNRIFLTGIKKENLSEKMFDESEFPDGYELKSKPSAPSPYLTNFLTDRNHRITRTVVMQRAEPETLTCAYTTFLPSGADGFPNNIELTAFDGRRNNKLRISLTKTEFDKTLNMTLAIPAKYTKADLSNIKIQLP